MMQAAFKLRDDLNYAGIIYHVASDTSADEISQCSQLKAIVKQAIANYLNPPASQLK